jgi:hypothetical protein
MAKYILSFVVVISLTLLISRRLTLSQRYDRPAKKAKEVSTWVALDRGIDPTDVSDKS